MAKETPMKVTTKARLQKIGEITMLGILSLDPPDK